MDVTNFKSTFATVDMGDVTLRVKAPTMAQTHELAKLVKALDFSAVAAAAKPVFDGARESGAFIAVLISELPRLLPVLADAIGVTAGDALFNAAIASLDTRHNLGRVLKACKQPGADDADLPIELDADDAEIAPDGTYLQHPGLRTWLRDTLTADVAWRVTQAAVILGGADMGKALMGRIAHAMRSDVARTAQTAPETATATSQADLET